MRGPDDLIMLLSFYTINEMAANGPKVAIWKNEIFSNGSGKNPREASDWSSLGHGATLGRRVQAMDWVCLPWNRMKSGTERKNGQSDQKTNGHYSWTVRSLIHRGRFCVRFFDFTGRTVLQKCKKLWFCWQIWTAIQVPVFLDYAEKRSRR